MDELKSYVGKLVYVKRNNTSTRNLVFVDEMIDYEGKIFIISKAFFGLHGDLRFYLKGCNYYQFYEGWVIILDENLLFLE